jgi:hypothetical protein
MELFFSAPTSWTSKFFKLFSCPTGHELSPHRCNSGMLHDSAQAAHDILAAIRTADKHDYFFNTAIVIHDSVLTPIYGNEVFR